MRIVTDIYRKIAENYAPAGAVNVRPSRDGSVTRARRDDNTLTVSSRARELEATAGSENQDQDKIARLKTALARGAFSVDANKIAEHVVDGGR